MGETADLLIAGGGVMGWATAFFVTRLAPHMRIVVVEPDPGHARSGTALSAASIRQQFTHEVNVRISRFGIEFIRSFGNWVGEDVDLGLVENGYLFLAASNDAAAHLMSAAQMQRRLGAKTIVLSREALRRRFPWMRVDDVVAATFGPTGEGWFDNMGLLSGLRRAAVRRGVRQVTDAVSVLYERTSWEVQLTSGGQISTASVVLAAGTGTRELLHSVGENIPVEARKRTVFVIDCPAARLPSAPLWVDPSGLWARPEGRFWLCAATLSPDPEVGRSDFAPDDAAFENQVWPKLVARSDAFETLKVVRSWAGHYDYNTFDQNAVVGVWPGRRSLYVLNGFSGHGLQQAPALGRGIAELVVDGCYRTIDLSALGAERLADRSTAFERAII